MTAAPALDYGEFLAAKVAHDSTHGFARHGAPHPVLKPHQADLIDWAVRGGRRAIFAAHVLGAVLGIPDYQQLIREHTP